MPVMGRAATYEVNPGESIQAAVDQDGQDGQLPEETNSDTEDIIPDKDELMCTNNVINPEKGESAI